MSFLLKSNDDREVFSRLNKKEKQPIIKFHQRYSVQRMLSTKSSRSLHPPQLRDKWHPSRDWRKAVASSFVSVDGLSMTQEVALCTAAHTRSITIDFLRVLLFTKAWRMLEMELVALVAVWNERTCEHQLYQGIRPLCYYSCGSSRCTKYALK